MTHVNLALAFAAGVLGFVSPCILPLIPGYISFVSGLSLQEIREGGAGSRARVMAASVLFVLGFALIFTMLGASASLVGAFILDNRQLLSRIGGAVVILIGLSVLGIIKIPVLYRERRFHITRRWGLLGALPAGMAFGFAWTPCVGPVLTAVLTLAAAEGMAARGAALLLAYAMGLGVPFLATALLLTSAIDALGWLKKYGPVVTTASGVFLLVMGIAMVTDMLYQLNIYLIKLFPFTPAI
ncbi:MAG: sulfite exporter TauE/SafE family protein [Armatimonadetes bacterium]|nr:sulfite exporter TauE/SafE family protein [Armatimonadota bacterium]